MSPHFHYKVSSSNHNGFSGPLFISLLYFIISGLQGRPLRSPDLVPAFHFFSMKKKLHVFSMSLFLSASPSQHCSAALRLPSSLFACFSCSRSIASSSFLSSLSLSLFFKRTITSDTNSEHFSFQGPSGLFSTSSKVVLKPLPAQCSNQPSD